VNPDALPATFTAAQAREQGISPRTLYRWRDDGEVLELSRGVFRRSDAPAATYLDLLAVSVRAPQSVVCGISAAVVHDLTDEAPHEVQIAIPNGAHVPRITYPPTKVFRVAAETWELGAVEVEAAPGEVVRVYDAARTVTDLIRWRHRVGADVAYSALNRYLALPGARPAAVYGYAKVLGAQKATLAALDVASAR